MFACSTTQIVWTSVFSAWSGTTVAWLCGATPKAMKHELFRYDSSKTQVGTHSQGPQNICFCASYQTPNRSVSLHRLLVQGVLAAYQLHTASLLPAPSPAAGALLALSGVSFLFVLARVLNAPDKKP